MIQTINLTLTRIWFDIATDKKDNDSKLSNRGDSHASGSLVSQDDEKRNERFLMKYRRTPMTLVVGSSIGLKVIAELMFMLVFTHLFGNHIEMVVTLVG